MTRRVALIMVLMLGLGTVVALAWAQGNSPTDANDTATTSAADEVSASAEDHHAADDVIDLHVESTTPAPLAVILIALATLISEDLTCVAAGLLVREEVVSFATALLGCLIGIYCGDVGLFLLGRWFGRPALRLKWVARRMTPRRLVKMGRWFDQHGFKAVVASRFMPGLRMPMYIAAGVIRVKLWKFALWTAIAVVIWTPLMVGLAFLLGHVVVEPVRQFIGHGWIALLVGILLVVLLFRWVEMLMSPHGVWKLRASVARIYRWEFWPAWVFYTPLVPWIAWLVFRYRGLRQVTATNPCMPHGGIVGEPKYDVLKQLPEHAVVPSALIEPGEASERFTAFKQVMRQRQWDYPLILKPNAGQRGLALRKINDDQQLHEYLDTHRPPILAQTYHPGPHEAGVFYVRHPDQAEGRIYSITTKEFPDVEGDGRSTLEALIWRHPRFRMQAKLFLRRHADQLDRVLRKGEMLRLAVAGNHCQGTKFLDATQWITEPLRKSIDEAAKAIDGFYFGRLDLRFADVEKFNDGEGYQIMEVNGLTAESTNLYDPHFSLWRAYRILFEQWRLAFEIGRANRKRGRRVSSFAEVWRELRSHYRSRADHIVTD